MPVAFALGLRTRLAVLAVVCVNLITNPPLNLASYANTPWRWQSSLLAASLVLISSEVGVTILEWRLLAWALDVDRRRLLVACFAMNAASALAGVALFWR